MHTELTVVITSGDSDRNDTWLRVKGDPHLVLKIKSKYYAIPKGVPSDVRTGQNLGDIGKTRGSLVPIPPYFFF